MLPWPDYVFVGGGIVVVVPCFWLASNDDGAIDLKKFKSNIIYRAKLWQFASNLQVVF